LRERVREREREREGERERECERERERDRERERERKRERERGRERERERARASTYKKKRLIWSRAARTSMLQSPAYSSWNVICVHLNRCSVHKCCCCCCYCHLLTCACCCVYTGASKEQASLQASSVLLGSPASGVTPRLHTEGDMPPLQRPTLMSTALLLKKMEALSMVSVYRR